MLTWVVNPMVPGMMAEVVELATDPVASAAARCPPIPSRLTACVVTISRLGRTVFSEERRRRPSGKERRATKGYDARRKFR
jgi:hypothetical protein